MDEQFKRETDEAIAMPSTDSTTVPNGYIGDELALAMLHALSRRLGADFVHEVRQEVIKNADRLAASDDPEDRMEVADVRAIAEAGFWERIATTSESA